MILATLPIKKPRSEENVDNRFLSAQVALSLVFQTEAQRESITALGATPAFAPPHRVGLNAPVAIARPGTNGASAKWRDGSCSLVSIGIRHVHIIVVTVIALIDKRCSREDYWVTANLLQRF